jgi:hypothetical protein
MRRVMKASGGTEGREVISNGFVQGKYTIVNVIVIYILKNELFALKYTLKYSLIKIN